MSQSTDYILLGNISGVHGLKGWLKIFSHTSPRLKITKYSQWFLKKSGEDWKEHKVLEGKEQGKNIIVRLEGVKDRNQVDTLIGSQIAIRKEQLEALSDGEYYWRDLIGIAVETKEGESLGRLDWIFNSGSNDVLVVKDSDAEKKERMLPFLFDDVVLSIDLDNSLMIVDWDIEF
ncbi:MAG TPA: ribosome maturation factor RimM [Leucothrix sp.]|nr:ribosome maturation factor RimM [Leucothrix sp.]